MPAHAETREILDLVPAFRRTHFTCAICHVRTHLDELHYDLALPSDGRKFILCVCHYCHLRRGRARWHEKRSLGRLAARIRRQGMGEGVELEWTRRRLNMERADGTEGA